VRLPKTLALDPSNAKALCEYVDGIKPDLENHCPAGSVIGSASATSPLLSRPLRGKVFFVKNVRIDPATGAERRTLPMIIAALRGEISINLRGASSVRGPKLVNTFADIPDAPVSRFSLNIAGGKNGILAVTETTRSLIDICRSKQSALVYMDAQNGKRRDVRTVMKTPCKKRAKRKKRR
jgi:hypothetical protein